MNLYYENYKLKEVKKRDERKNKHKYIYASVVGLLIALIIFIIYKQ